MAGFLSPNQEVPLRRLLRTIALASVLVALTPSDGTATLITLSLDPAPSSTAFEIATTSGIVSSSLLAVSESATAMLLTIGLAALCTRRSRQEICR